MSKRVEDLILEQLKTLTSKVDDLHEKVDKNMLETSVELAKVKTKSTIWGGISGAASSIVTALCLYFEMRR